MDYTAKLWLKYVLSVIITGVGVGMTAGAAYDIGRRDGVKNGAITMVRGIQEAYGEDDSEEIFEKTYQAIKNM